jgi:CBS domain containing-hemolysin-like protein
MMILIVIACVTIVISFNCSLYEATLYSTRSGALEASRAAGKKVDRATQLLEMKRKISVPIAAILIFNTVANVVGAFFAGIYASVVLGPSMAPVFSVLFTLAILFLGEIGPKTLGAVYWRQTWPFIVIPLKIMEYSMYPLIVITQAFSNLLTRGHKTPHVTEEEILAVVRMGAKEGEITHDESVFVHNVIDLENRLVREIMTPRTVIFSLDADMTVEEAAKVAHKKGFTRIPLYEREQENIIGYLIMNDLLSAKAFGDPHAIVKSMAKPIFFVPESNNLLVLLQSFLKHRRHIAIIVDEYGGVEGLVTLEDLIETLLGDEIVDETDRVVDLREKARQLMKNLTSA